MTQQALKEIVDEIVPALEAIGLRVTKVERYSKDGGYITIYVRET